MGIAAAVCNVVLVVFTCLVIATDGVPREVPYIVFGFLLLAVPILSAVVLVLGRAHRGDCAPEASPRCGRASRIAVLCNALLLAAACWAIVDQYPHPDEEGIFVYTALVLLTPIVSIVALLGDGKGSAASRRVA